MKVGSIGTLVALGVAMGVALLLERRVEGDIVPAAAEDPLERVITDGSDPAASPPDGGRQGAAGPASGPSSRPPSQPAPPTSLQGTSTTSTEPLPTTAVPATPSTTTAAGPVSGAADGGGGTSGPVRPITLAFAGDVHFEGFLAERLRQDPAGMLAPVAPVLAAADVAVVNLETNVTERGEPEPKTYTFRAPESAYSALAAAGVDIVSVANNHGRDFGEVALLDTLDAAARHGLAVVGGGRSSAEAYGARHIDAAGRRIAVLAATHVLDTYALDSWVAGEASPGLASAYPPYRQRLIDTVSAEAGRADVVAVYLHWGRERETCPTEDQQTLAQELVAAGADVVVGTHAHRLQGGGRMGAAVVHYGLGNFVFYKQSGPGTESGVFEVTVGVDGTLSYRWVPAALQAGVATPLQGEAAGQQLAAWDGLRACTGLAA